MKIGGMQVGEYVVKSVGGKRALIFDCKHCPYRASIAEDHHCRFHVLKILGQLEADTVVFAEVYERVYAEAQTKMLMEVANLAQKFVVQSIWSYNHLGRPKKECEPFFPERHRIMVKIARDLITFDPLLAYLTLMEELKKQEVKVKQGSAEYIDCAEPYVATLVQMKNSFDILTLTIKARKLLTELTEIPNTKVMYKSIFEAEIKPSFIGSKLSFEGMENLELMDEYNVRESTVQVFSDPDRVEKIYQINPPEYSLAPDQYFILSKTREIVASYRPGKTSLSTVATSRKYFERLYEATIKEVAQFHKVRLSPGEMSSLSKVVARYTVGYGILEVLLNDRRVTDIYLDAPIGGKPIYVVHSDYGQCQTNVTFTENESNSLISKLRAMSARPFDEAHPVLDFDLQDLETRVAVIGPPLSPSGAAYAFRLHKLTPWTLEQFIDVDYLNPLAAGMISFFIDMQSTTLIAGSRGSGKTSLLGATIQEIPQNSRIIIQEDTMELPVDYLKNIGFNIQRLKTKSAISVSKTETEVAPEEALRTSLRLGDSALILGEVRSTEAKVLYEAMRVGAAGNVVMGTIHADSAYSVWDRVVNDLGVPTTSFKATDIVIVARPIRFKGSLTRHRRVVEITEVKKHWDKDPEREGGLLKLMSYEAKTDNLELQEDNLKESDLLKKIQKTSGLSVNDIWSEIRLRGNAKLFLVEQKSELDLPELLEAINTSSGNNKLLLMKEKMIEEEGSVNYDQLLGQWKNWVTTKLIPRVKRASVANKKKKKE
ncbi:MAG: type II/IV secretion system ATPase subunit [Candidatus Diapherotrites archaeon]|jgi:archaeal flagellar protein FlaI|uniref:Type II/IV secretion system ATPase subunit n=1 Tax=Candidatus Iainarchaeum sp. TaxID=3101447 RepID=A0A8T5GEI7_9ARCH|nr:type II/IV secretion system ATPase subunit [Candidatus Diapherotrites archaeon]MBT7241248.1 type II/IV secretion system ATPase subunit [Candidatus Diapherotrites archaeon]